MTPASPKPAGQTEKPDRALLSLLVCPQTRGLLIYHAEAGELISPQAGRAFPIRSGVPVLIEAEARQLSDAEILRWRRKKTGPSGGGMHGG